MATGSNKLNDDLFYANKANLSLIPSLQGPQYIMVSSGLYLSGFPLLPDSSFKEQIVS